MRVVRAASGAIAAVTLAGAAVAGVGTGWTRAADLSVYSSAEAYARIAWEQQVYCQHSNPERASARMARDFGARDAAVRAALVARHGEAALERTSHHFVQRVPCGDLPDGSWRQRYSRTLRVLEIRLGIA